MRTKLNSLVLGVIFSIFLGSCGTGTGNPEVNATHGGSEPDFEAPIQEYNENDIAQIGGVDCGSFTDQSTPDQIESGRQCIRDAFAACNSARYLLDETNAEGERFVSFVAVETSTCQLRVHTVSEDASRFVGDQTQTCSTLTEPIELACGIGS